MGGGVLKNIESKTTNIYIRIYIYIYIYIYICFPTPVGLSSLANKVIALPLEYMQGFSYI